MAYWDTREDLLARLASNYYWANYYRKSLAVNINNASHSLGEGDIPSAVGWCITCLINCSQIFTQMIGRQGAISPNYNLIYFLSKYTSVTWKSICEAWAKDDFEGKEWTIACIDHMRKLMWDKPFSIIWASKPEGTKE